MPIKLEYHIKNFYTAKKVFLIKQKFSNALLVLRNIFLEIRIQVKNWFVRFHDYLFSEIVVKHE